MGLWNTFCGLFSTDSDSADIDCGSSTMNGGCDINPATGLPMISDCGGVDVGGSPFGTDIHDDSWSTSSMDFSDDSWTTSSCSFDDSFSSGIGNSWDD